VTALVLARESDGTLVLGDVDSHALASGARGAGCERLSDGPSSACALLERGSADAVPHSFGRANSSSGDC